jgi:hypothetical protein
MGAQPNNALRIRMMLLVALCLTANNAVTALQSQKNIENI